VLNRLKHLFDRAKTHQGFRRYFANSSWMFAEQMVRLIAGLLVGIWVARYLGPEQFGLFSYAIAFSAIFGSLAKLGLDGIVVRDLVRAPNQRDLILGTAFWLKMSGAVILLTVVAIAIQLTSSDTTTKLYILIIASGTIFQSFEVVDFYFQSRVLSKFVSGCKLAQLLTSSLLKLYLIYAGADLFWFVLVSLVDQVVLAFSYFIAYRYQKVGAFYRHFNFAIAKILLRDNWPLIIGGIFAMAYMRIDQIMIKEMLGEKDIGIYSAAIRLAEVWYVVPMIITRSLFPAIVSAKKMGEKLYLSRLQRLHTLLLWMGIAFALPMTFLSDWLVILLYGEAYREAGPVLMIQVWAGIFFSLGVASGSWYTSENLQKFALYRAMLAAVVNVVLNLILIPIIGLIGAAISSVIAHSVMALFFDAISKRTRIIFLMKLKTLQFANLFQRG
jgi:O-antigen/teichoic acid export membrane protein